MAGRYNTNYGGNDNGNNGSNGSNDWDDRARLSLPQSAAIEGAIQRISQNTHDRFGTSLIVNMDDVELIDGILMERTDDSEKLKVFSWEDFGFDRDDDGIAQVPEDEIPRRQSIDVGNNTYSYKTIDSAIEGAEGRPGESVFVGDVEMFLGSTSKGRSLAKVLSTHGDDAVSEEDDEWNDDFKWLNNDVAELRDEIAERKIELFFKPVTYETTNDNDETVERSFSRAILLDSKTGERIPPLGEVSGEVESSTEEDTDADDGSEDETEDDTSELPDEAQPVLELYVDRGEVPDPDDVKTMLDSQLGDDNEDEYVDAIVEKAEAAA